MKPQNKQMHCRISPRRTCNPCGYTMKMSSRYHKLLIYDVKRTTEIDGMEPFKSVTTDIQTDCHYLCVSQNSKDRKTYRHSHRTHEMCL